MGRAPRNDAAFALLLGTTLLVDDLTDGVILKERAEAELLDMLGEVVLGPTDRESNWNDCNTKVKCQHTKKTYREYLCLLMQSHQKYRKDLAL